MPCHIACTADVQQTIHIVAMLLINIYPKLLIEMKEKQTPLPL